MDDFIVKFKDLKDHIKKSELGYKESIREFYKVLGEKNGFAVRENSTIIRYGLNLGKIDLIWLDPNITFTIEFSNLEDILKQLWKISELSPELAVLILSSKSGCKATDVKKLIDHSELTKNRDTRFMLLDLSEEKVL